MKCKIDGCEREAMYKNDCVCQKHYFRFMRNGRYELKERKYRLSNPAGYQKLHEPNHPLVNSDGYVYEHRKIIYDLYGNNLPNCDICGKDVNWETCHIDHIDEDVTNNKPENLRPVCRGCNTGRTERITIEKFTLNGKTMSLTKWSKEEGVQVTRAQIIRRMAQGMTLEEALYTKPKTHQNKKCNHGYQGMR